MIASRRTRAIYAVPECTEAHVFQSIQQLDSGGNSDGRGLRRPASRAASALLEKMSFSGSLGVASETKDSTLSSMSCGLPTADLAESETSGAAVPMRVVTPTL